MTRIVACGLPDGTAVKLAALVTSFGDASTLVVARTAQDGMAMLAGCVAEGHPAALLASMASREAELLLRRVDKELPNVTRFAIARGLPDSPESMNHAAHAHRMLSESASPERWMDLMRRTCALRAQLSAPAVRRLVNSLKSLPAVPRAYWALMDALSSNHTNAGDIAQIVQTEPSMAIRVLQIANSAFFGSGRQVTTIEHAVRYLGTDLLRGLVLMSHVCGCCDTGGASRHLSLEQFQDFSLRVARVARALPSHRRVADEAYTAGLLLDIGRLALSLAAPEEFEEIHRRVAQGEPHLHIVERDVLGVSHAEVGASLLAGWGLPWPLVEAIAFHHTPSALGSTNDCEVLAVVHAADALLGIAHSEPDDQLDVDFLTRAGWSGELARCRELAQKEVAGT